MSDGTTEYDKFITQSTRSQDTAKARVHKKKPVKINPPHVYLTVSAGILALGLYISQK